MYNLKLQNLQKKTYDKIFGFLQSSRKWILIYSDRKQVSICLGWGKSSEMEWLGG